MCNCKTCDKALSRGHMPLQKCGQQFEVTFSTLELSCLIRLEIGLVCLRVAFMKMGPYLLENSVIARLITFKVHTDRGFALLVLSLFM